MGENKWQVGAKLLEDISIIKQQNIEFQQNLLQQSDHKDKQRIKSMIHKDYSHLQFFSNLYYQLSKQKLILTKSNKTQDVIYDDIRDTITQNEILQNHYNQLAATFENSELDNTLERIKKDEQNQNNYFNQVLLNKNIVILSTISYTVQVGDSLWLISQKFDTTVNDILSVNPQIIDPSPIYVEQVIQIPVKETIKPPLAGRESLTYLYGGTTASYEKIIAQTKSSLYTVSPDYFDVDDSGNLLITFPGKIDENFIQEMHKQGIKVVPFISNHWDRVKGNTALDNRERLSTQIAEKISQYNLDGINIDIENVNEQYRSAYTDFTRLLRQKLPSNKEVSVAVAANPKNFTLGWHGSYDYNALSQYADYLMIMGYDESYYGGPAGPVSSSSFFEQSIQYALKNNVPKEKIVMGIPFFGRYWKQGESVGGIGIAAKDIQYLIDNYSSTVRYDETTQSANAVVTIKPDDPKPQIWGGRILDTGVYNIWYDNLIATRYKLDLINQYDLLGAGSWALGQENPAVWDFYTSVLNGGNIPEVPGPEPGPGP